MGEERITQSHVEITLADGQVWKVFPLTLKAVKEVSPLLKKLQTFSSNTDVTNPEVFDILIKLATKVLQRTNPDLNEEKVAELVDVYTIKDIIDVGMGGMGKTLDRNS